MILRGFGVKQTIVTRGLSYFRRIADGLFYVIKPIVRKTVFKLNHEPFDSTWKHESVLTSFKHDAVDTLWSHEPVVVWRNVTRRNSHA